MAINDLPFKVQTVIQLKARGFSHKEITEQTGYKGTRITELVCPSGLYAKEVEEYRKFLAEQNVEGDLKRLEERHQKAEDLMNELYALAKSSSDPIAKIRAAEQFLDRCPEYAKSTKTESKIDQTVNKAKEIVWRLPKTSETN